MKTKLFDSTLLSTAKGALDFIGNILESSTEYSIIGMDLTGKVLLRNEGARRLYGYEPDEIIGIRSSEILYVPEDVEKNKPEQILKDAVKNGKWEGTIKRMRKNGEIFLARVVVTVRKDSNDNPVGFLLISKDISDEIRLSDEIKATQIYTRSLIESNSDTLMLTDALGIISDANKQMELLTGFSRNELIGTPFKEYFSEPKRAEEGIKLVLTQGRVTNFELTALSKDGRKTLVSYNAS